LNLFWLLWFNVITLPKGPSIGYYDLSMGPYPFWDFSSFSLIIIARKQFTVFATFRFSSRQKCQINNIFNRTFKIVQNMMSFGVISDTPFMWPIENVYYISYPKSPKKFQCLRVFQFFKRFLCQIFFCIIQGGAISPKVFCQKISTILGTPFVLGAYIAGSFLPKGFRPPVQDFVAQ
jgi:hypothetical protein